MKDEGGMLNDIIVSKEITHTNLLAELYNHVKVDPTEFDIMIRCIYEIKLKHETPPFDLNNNRDLKFYIIGENTLEVPTYGLI